MQQTLAASDGKNFGDGAVLTIAIYCLGTFGPLTAFTLNFLLRDLRMIETTTMVCQHACASKNLQPQWRAADGGSMHP